VGEISGNIRHRPPQFLPYIGSIFWEVPCGWELGRGVDRVTREINEDKAVSVSKGCEELLTSGSRV
jgi:hypothetical protein